MFVDSQMPTTFRSYYYNINNIINYLDHTNTISCLIEPPEFFYFILGYSFIIELNESLDIGI